MRLQFGGLRTAALGIVVLIAALASSPADASTFAPTNAIKLCAYSGQYLQNPCGSETGGTGANADITLTVSVSSGQAIHGLSAFFVPQAAQIPGPETNTRCANGSDDDGDGSVNDGCPIFGSTVQSIESNQCRNSFNDDAIDDAMAGPALVNDGCLPSGSAETGAQCSDSADSDGDGLINDGCPQSGAAEPEFDQMCDNSVDDDPRDDLGVGSQRVNDGCPAVGPAETACSDAADDDGDTKVNDGCPTVGAANSEVDECANGVDDDADAAINDGCPEVGSPIVGSVAGKIFNSTKVAFFNNVCNSSLPLSAYPLFASTTDNGAWNEFSSLPQGSVGAEGPLEPFRDEANGNGLPRHVDRYPSFLNKLFDPDRVGDINGDGDEFDTVNGVAENAGASPVDPYGTVEPLRPLARYSGSTVLSDEAHLLQVLVFLPGTLAAFQAPHALSDLGASAIGYPMVIVVDDPITRPGPAPVTDSCTPSTTRILLWGKTRDNPCTAASPPCPNDDTPCSATCGDNVAINSLPGLVDSGSGPCSGTNEAGCVRYANPSTAGTHLFYVYQQSQRDADDDGKENALDTCPTTFDTLDPRTGAGPDADGDLIADACDTYYDPSSDDQDGDGFSNTQDNCPQIANGDQKESETVTPYLTAAKRGGSRADGIGDACDPNPTLANGHFHTVFSVIPKCIGETDSDGDGWCDSTETSLGSNPSNAASTPEHPSIVLSFALTNAGSGGTTGSPGNVGDPKQACNDGFDNDGDGLTDVLDGSFTWNGSIYVSTGCQLVDTDGDAYDLGHEGSYLGTNPLSRCPATATANDEAVDAWPPDLNDDQRVNMTDTLSFIPYFGMTVPPGPARWDLTGDSRIGNPDILALIPVFNTTC